MSSGVGVTYELEFIVKDTNARKAIERMTQQALKLVKTLDRVTLSKATGAVRKFNNELKNSKEILQSVSAQKKNIEKAVKNPLVNVEKGAKKSEKAIDKLVRKIQTGFLYKAGGFLFQQGQQAFSDFSNIDFDIRSASAKIGGFGKDYAEMFMLTNKIGADTRFTNSDIAKALNAGATLGIKRDEMKKILPSAADLAQAFNSEVVPAMEMIKMHMNTYNLSQDQAVRVTDMLAATAKNSAADLERLANGFSYVGSQAMALNIPMEQVYAVLGKLNDSGIMGSSAGTAFNNFLVNLSNIKKRSKLEEIIGKVTDEKGNLLELSNILERIKSVTDKMGNADKASLFQQLFGIRGGKAINTFMNQGVEGLKKLQDQIKNSSGITRMMSKYMMSGPAGAIEELLSTLESAFQSIFNSLSPLIVPVAVALKMVADGIILINKNLPWLGQLVAIFSALFVGKVVFAYIAAKMVTLIPIIKKTVASFLSLKGILLGGVVLAMIILFNKFQEWMDYLSQNEKAQKKWEQSLRLVGYALSNLMDLIVAIIDAIFGFNDSQEDAVDKNKKVEKTLEKLNDTLFKLNIRIQEMRRWVEQNKESVRIWGIVLGGLMILKFIIPLIHGLNTALLFLAKNPIVLKILIVIGAIYGLWKALEWLYNNVEWFRDGVNVALSFIKEHWRIVFGTLAMILGMMLGPIGAFVGGILWVIGVLVDLYNTNETARQIMDEAWKVIKEVVKGAADIVAGAINGITEALKGALGALKDLLNGDWEGLKNRMAGMQAVKNAQSRVGNVGNYSEYGRKAVGTDYFQGWKYGNMTTVDENGDELAWLPNGTMIVRNQTSREMLNAMKSISNNTRSRTSSGNSVVQNNNVNIYVNGGREAANELIKELEILGIG